MKNHLLLLLLTCFLGSTFAQDTTEVKSPKRQSFGILLGTSDMWYQNYPTRRDFVQSYTHFGIQYAAEVKPNVDIYGTLLFGTRGSKNMASAGLGLRYYLLDREKHKNFRPFANFSGEILADNSTRSTYSDVDLTGSIGSGFDFKIFGSLYGRAMVNLGFPFFQIGKVDFTDGRGTYAHYTGGLVYEWGNKPKPAPAPAKVAEPVSLDTDGDGIVDKEDKCPTVKGVRANNGCPADTDGDGIIDADDKCPTVAGVKENQGCPADSDGDGIIDSEDACPTVPGVKANKGCPADSDGDGVIDTEDLMPTIAGLVALQGVPENVIIYFDTDHFDLTAESTSIVDAMIKLLTAQPSLKLKLTGHTDSRQTVQYNVELSKNRVFETRKYLIKNGVNAKRMKLSWFSELVPAAPNKTVDGMKLNRRVELKVSK